MPELALPGGHRIPAGTPAWLTLVCFLGSQYLDSRAGLGPFGPQPACCEPGPQPACDSKCDLSEVRAAIRAETGASKEPPLSQEPEAKKGTP